jgi:hypothetical protein
MAGRNDPCPCGSGKKYKKCCLGKGREEPLRQSADIPASPPSLAPAGAVAALSQPSSVPTKPAAPIIAPPAAPSKRPRTPSEERANALWERFEAEEGEDRIASFHEALDDHEVMTDDLAFEMMAILHQDAVASGDRRRFAALLGELRERLPDVYNEGAHYYLSWSLLDALVEGRQEDVAPLARDLAARSGRDLEAVNRGIAYLQYHGQQHALVEALRIGWPFVKSSKKYFGWAIAEFAQNGVNHEIFEYLERTDAFDPADPVLLDRVRFFTEEVIGVDAHETVVDLAGTSGREWKADDFALRPSRQKPRDEWDDDEEEDEPHDADPGALNLHRLMMEFVGYLRREEGVPFPRGELVRQQLSKYFARRHAGDLDPRPSMLELARNPNKKLPKPPPPIHPLCPERVTLESHLAGLMGMMNHLYHPAAALFLAMPAWLRFLESRRLINAGTSTRVVKQLRPLHDLLIRHWERYQDDSTLYREGLEWPGAPTPMGKE